LSELLNIAPGNPAVKNEVQEMDVEVCDAGLKVTLGGVLSTTFTVCENVLERHPSLAVQTLEKVYDD